jgi:chromosome segregation ATPase
MDYAARLRQLRAEIEAAMSSLADSRAERSQLQKKVQSLESELKRKQELAAARKRELLEYDKAKRRIRAASSKVTQLVQQLRRKELKVADLRRMVAGNKKRLAAVEKEDMEAAARLPPHLKTLSSSFEGAAANEVGEEPAPVSEEVKQKALVKRCAALKLQLDKLVAQGKSLQKEHGHLAKKVKDVETKRQLQQQKVLKQQQALALEAQRKAQHQLETEAAHLRDNHIKGLRHREREHQARLQEEEACRQQVVTRITAAVSASQILVKELAELKSRHSCLVTTMDEADRRNRERQVELETKATEWKLLLAVVSEKKKKLSGIEYEQQVAQEKLSAAESFTRADAANDKERQQLLKKIADAATQQQIIAKATNDLEESIAKVKAQRVVSLASSTLPAHIAELQRSILSLQGQLEQEKKDQAAEAAKRSKELRETQTTQAQMDLKLDRRIEELTQQHTSHRSELAAHNARNTALLEELDQKERLVAMHNFGNKQ